MEGWKICLRRKSFYLQIVWNKFTFPRSVIYIVTGICYLSSIDEGYHPQLQKVSSFSQSQSQWVFDLRNTHTKYEHCTFKSLYRCTITGRQTYRQTNRLWTNWPKIIFPPSFDMGTLGELVSSSFSLSSALFTCSLCFFYSRSKKQNSYQSIIQRLNVGNFESPSCRVG